MADVASLTLSESAPVNGNSHQNGKISNKESMEAFVDRTVAISANTPELVPGLVDEVAALGKVANLQDHKDRSTLLETARSLVYALETPREAMIRYCWSQATLYAALETGVDLGVFAVLSKDDKPKTAAELANATGADPVLLGM